MSSLSPLSREWRTTIAAADLAIRVTAVPDGFTIFDGLREVQVELRGGKGFGSLICPSCGTGIRYLLAYALPVGTFLSLAEEAKMRSLRSHERHMLVAGLAALMAMLLSDPGNAADEVRPPQAEFGGFYQAQAEGLYSAAGLDVTIRPGGPQINTPQLIIGGALDLQCSPTRSSN